VGATSWLASTVPTLLAIVTSAPGVAPLTEYVSTVVPS
jgi:hypothetical protein